MDENKRKYKRVPMAGSARLTYSDVDGVQTIESTIASISPRGIGLYTDCMLKQGTLVLLELNFIAKDELMKTDRLKGRVVNANEVEGLCYLCIVFHEAISPQKQHILYAHLKDLLH